MQGTQFLLFLTTVLLGTPSPSPIKKFCHYFLQVDVYYYGEEKPDDDNAHARCRLPVKSFPGGPTEGKDGHIIFQCHGKKMNFFIMMLVVQIAMLGMYSRLSRSFTARGSVSGEPTKGIRLISSRVTKLSQR